MANRAFAIAAHPDDIEFMMAGTLALLRQAGHELHYMTLADGSCGSKTHDASTMAQLRRSEALAAAHLLDATYHESLVSDLEIFFESGLLRRLAAVVREVSPHLILTQSMSEYMEDHVNTTRLVLTAAFARGMPNFSVDPPQPAIDQSTVIYHALPYGLRDPLRRRVYPGIFVDISEVIATKREALSLHASQRAWLDATQGIGSYLRLMEEMAIEIGHESGEFTLAEGWTRHLHLGYSSADHDPLVDALGRRALVSKEFEKSLDPRALNRPSSR